MALRRRHRVLMVCDFFWPSIGGVETHLWSLAQCLLRAGHHVCVLTHAWGDRCGVRRMTNGLKAYYAPWRAAFSNCTLPSFFPLLPLLREICVREGIEVVHGHQDSSAMVHEALFHAATLGVRTVFTSHSLFNVFDTASLHLNKVLRFTLSATDHVVSVSRTAKENMVVRCGLSPARVSTIPNAVDAARFTPGPELRDKGQVTVVVINRLAYRKGADLVAQVIPLACRAFPQVSFVIAGDGDKRLLLDEMRERHQLHTRVELLGAVPHTEVRSVLCRGAIFLNCSLTEAFCMAILEAASCGLFVVSTKVGGIPEVLAPDMVDFADEPTAEAVFAALARAVRKELDRSSSSSTKPQPDPFALHTRVKAMYDWNDIAARVTKVYDRVAQAPRVDLADRLAACRDVGPIAGVFAALLVAIDTLLLTLLQAWRPRDDIELAPELVLDHIPVDR